MQSYKSYPRFETKLHFAFTWFQWKRLEASFWPVWLKFVLSCKIVNISVTTLYPRIWLYLVTTEDKVSGKRTCKFSSIFFILVLFDFVSFFQGDFRYPGDEVACHQTDPMTFNESLAGDSGDLNRLCITTSRVICNVTVSGHVRPTLLSTLNSKL